MLIRRTQAATSDEVSKRLQIVFDLLASAVENERFHEAAMAFVTRMANSLECDRVSIGFFSGRHTKVTAVSHSADFGKQTNLVRAIESAMDEAIDQQAVHDRAQIHISMAKIEQAAAQIFLIDEQMARCRIIAPFDGVVMSGDLSQSLGAPVERGQVLFEVAPLDEYRVIAEVDERDINSIVMGQKSDLVLPSIPGRTFPFVVKKITPVSIAKDGRNYFRVEGYMVQSQSHLRPGMEGIGKINIDQRKLIWVWTHKAIDWLRLQMWRWFP